MDTDGAMRTGAEEIAPFLIFLTPVAFVPFSNFVDAYGMVPV